MQKKILYITHVTSLYGANRSLVDMIDNLDCERFLPYVVMPREAGELARILREMGISYKQIYMKSTVHKEKDCRRFEKLQTNLRAVKEITDCIKLWNIDIVHTNSSVINLGAVAALLTGKKHIWHYREVLKHYEFKMDMPFLNGILVNKADKVICISQYIKHEINQSTKNKNLQVCYNPIELDNYAIQRKQLFQSSEIRILVCGMISENKGQMQVIQALYILLQKGYSNLKLTIVGTGRGAYISQLKHFILEHEMEECVSIYPYCQDLSQYRKDADIAVVSSLYEGLGRVTIESMLSELVVIGAASGATCELIKDGYNGLKYQPESAHHLAEKLEYVLLNKEKAVRMIKNAKKFAIRNFDAKKQMEKIQNIYEKI